MSQRSITEPHIWSNLAYVLAGIASLVFVPNSLIVALGLFILGFTSWMGHWKGDKWWIADWIGMYVTFLAVSLFNVNLSVYWFVLAPIVSWLAWKYHSNSFIRIGTFWISSVTTSFIAGVNIVPVLILFALALGIRQIAPDMNQKYYNLCHGLWHALTATGIFLLIKFILF